MTSSRVGIISIGWYGFSPSTPEVSFREMMFESSNRAYSAVGIDPRKEVDAFVVCQEDYWEGIAITNEFAPEPLGGVLRPTVTIAGDGLQCIVTAYQLIKTGYFDIVAVEAHSKASNIATLSKIYEIALDPHYVRPLYAKNPLFLAGLEARAYMERTGAEKYHLALVAVKNKNNGLNNPRASYATPLDLEDVVESKPVIDPLTSYEIAPFVDVSITFLLAGEESARKFTDTPIWIEGVGWSTETGTGAIAWHEWGRMRFLRDAANQAYRIAGISNPARSFDFAEVEDRFSYAELVALEELKLAQEGTAHILLESGDFDIDGYLPVNPSGGSLSIGVALEATGLVRILEATLRLWSMELVEEAEGRAVVASWRGIPSFSGGVVVLSL